MNALHHSPATTQTAGLCGEGVNLIGTSPHISKEAFNGIRAANMPMHCLGEVREGQEMRFILTPTAHCLWIALTVLALKGRSFCQRLLLCGWVADPR
jgi:hypothetical protein